MNNVTIMKYRIGKEYKFKVLDKFDVKDEADRLSRMMELGRGIQSKNKDSEILWIKTTPII